MLAAENLDGSFAPGASNHRRLRDALGSFGTGVTIVTAATENGPVAITVNSFASVSLSPALVLWSLDRSSARYPGFINAEYFAIHVLNENQAALCMEVARSPGRLLTEPLDANHRGVPVLTAFQARFDCRRESVHTAGDHDIIIGRVELATDHADGSPLLFYQGSTGTFASHSDHAG